MTNAKDLTGIAHEKILLIGETGTGKSTQLLTLPGRKFVYIFDTNALATYAGFDIEYETFFAEAQDIDFMPRSIRKGGKQMKDTIKGAVKTEPQLYLDWAEDVNKKVEEGFFNDYDVVALDSLTLWGAAAMDRVMFLQQQMDRDDERTDYRITGDVESNALRALASLPCTLVCMVHNDMWQDDKTKRIYKRITLHGGARVRVPLLFTNVWVTLGEEGEKGYEYVIQTRPDRENPVARTTVPGLEFTEDVTIPSDVFDRKGDLTDYGIGGILKRAGRIAVKGNGKKERKVAGR